MALRAALFAMMAFTAPAEAACRLALALGLDVSGSVDAIEYRLQLDGLAHALESPKVAAQILAQPETPVIIAVYEWSGAASQSLILDWTEITSDADLARVALSIRARTRQIVTDQATAIGAAIGFAAALFEAGPSCWTRTLDLSGDGKNNDGPRPIEVVERWQGFGINALVIGSDATRGRDERQMEVMDLSAYFRRRVIRGPGAFVEVALGFSDYERAMERKLLRETALPQMGALE